MRIVSSLRTTRLSGKNPIKTWHAFLLLFIIALGGAIYQWRTDCFPCGLYSGSPKYEWHDRFLVYELPGGRFSAVYRAHCYEPSKLPSNPRKATPRGSSRTIDVPATVDRIESDAFEIVITGGPALGCRELAIHSGARIQVKRSMTGASDEYWTGTPHRWMRTTGVWWRTQMPNIPAADD